MLKTVFNDVVLKRMFKNASVLLSGGTLAGLMGLISLSLAARTLGAEKLGVFALIQSYTIIIDRLMNFQCWQAVIKFGADFLKQDRKEDFKSLVKFCTILDAATAAGGTFIAAAIVYIIGQWKGWQQQTIYAAIAYSFWILFNLKGTATGLLRLFNRFKLITAANIIAAFLKLILAAIAYIFSGSLLIFVIIWVFAGIAESAFLLLSGWKEVYAKTGDNFLKAKLSIAAKDKNIWKFVLSTNLNQSVRLASREFDVLITGAVLGTALTGIYKIARQFAGVLANLIEPVYQAIYPELAHLAAEKRFSDLKHTVARTAVISGIASLLIWLVFAVTGKWILGIAAGKQFIQAWNVTTIFMLAFVIWGFAFCLPAGLLAIGRAGKILLVQTIALAVFLPAIYLLLVNIGLVGAAAAQVIYFAVYSLLMLLFFIKYISVMERSFSTGANNFTVISGKESGMETEKQWLYYNIHDLIRIRLQKDHMSRRSFDLFFGPFKTDFLNEEEIDLSVQNHAPEISEYGDASGSYYYSDNHLYFIKYKTHLLKKNGSWILAGQRDLLSLTRPVLQMLFLRKKHCVIHSASVSINGRGVLLPGWGGTGKTSAIICILKEIAGSSFLSDDYSFISADSIYSNPKAFFIYPYHQQLFPHLFKPRRKILVPSCFSDTLEKIRIVARPGFMAFPRLENIARRITPEHMQVPAREALPDFEFSDKAKIDTVLFIERHSNGKTVLEDISIDRARQRLIGNWLYEENKCGQEMIVAMGGTGIIDLSEYFSQMGEIIDSACRNRTVKLLKIPKMLPHETGRIIAATLKEIMKIN
jgi:O-antigen/teichoic acid export membrane protein